MEIIRTELPQGKLIEYLIQDRSQKSTHSGSSLHQKNLSLEKYAELYRREKLIEVNGKKYPAVLIKKFSSLGSQSIKILSSSYEIPKRFRKFAESILNLKVEPTNFNGSVLGVKKIDSDGENISLTVEETKYFDFIATTLAQDVYLDQFDETFKSGETLRDYEITNGRAVSLQESNLANILGVGFLVFNERERLFILGKRRKNLVASGGEFTILGGTPMWNPGWNAEEKIDFTSYLQEHIEEEMEEELCLKKGEFYFKKGFWIKDFNRAPTLLTCINTEIPIEKIARRCLQSESAKKEHVSLLGVPANLDSIYALSRGFLGYQINAIASVGTYLCLS